MKMIIGFVALLAVFGYARAQFAELKHAPEEISISKGCKFNGKYYAIGAIPKEFCFIIECTTKGWVNTGGLNPKCAECRLWQDPNVRTFDNNYYDWHGFCNYTVTQPLTVSNENYNVHSQFKQCTFDSSASCVYETYFKANLHTAVTVRHDNLPNIRVNNGPWISIGAFQQLSPYPLFVWYQSATVYIQGPQHAVKLSDRNLYVFVGQHHSKNLVGLCGYFDNDNGNNDHRRRDGITDTPLLYPLLFPVSWLSHDQPSCKCFDPRNYLAKRFLEIVLGSSDLSTAASQIRENQCEREEEFRRECWTNAGSPRDPIDEDTQAIIESCVRELCRGSSNREFWLQGVRETVEEEQVIARQTLIAAESEQMTFA